MSAKDITFEYVGRLLDEVNKSEKLASVKYNPEKLLIAINDRFVYTPLQYKCLLNDIENELFNGFEDLITKKEEAI